MGTDPLAFSGDAGAQTTAPTTPPVSLILSVYERPRYLALVLEALRRQSVSGFELLIADDGSGEEVGKVLADYSKEFPGGLIRVRQAHEGFRKARIVNQAARRARAERLIFVDGDCLCHRRFVEDHLELGRRFPEEILSGRRVELGAKLSARIDKDWVNSGKLEAFLPYLWRSVFSDVRYAERALRVDSEFLFRMLNREPPRVVGCNMSMPRRAFEKVGGYDERITGRGGEDVDLERRLRQAGFSIRTCKGRAIQYHLWHPVTGLEEANRT